MPEEVHQYLENINNSIFPLGDNAAQVCWCYDLLHIDPDAVVHLLGIVQVVLQFLVNLENGPQNIMQYLHNTTVHYISYMSIYYGYGILLTVYV